MRSIFKLREFQWAVETLGLQVKEIKLKLSVTPFEARGQLNNSLHRVILPSGSTAIINIIAGKTTRIDCQGLCDSRDEKDVKHAIHSLGFKIQKMDYSHVCCSADTVSIPIEPQAIFTNCNVLRRNLYKQSCVVCIKTNSRFCFRGRGCDDFQQFLRFVRNRVKVLVDFHAAHEA